MTDTRASDFADRRWIPRQDAVMALFFLTIVPHPSPAGAASKAVRVVGTIGLGDPFGSSVAALGDNYTFVGTSTGRTLDVVDQQRGTLRASLNLPGLTPFGIVPLNMDMSALTISPDNRYLYVLNRLRQDVDVFDLTGATAPRAIAVREDAGHALSLSLDGTVLAVVGTLGATFLDTRRGTTLETIGWPSAVASSSRAVYILAIQGANAAVGEIMGGHIKRSFKLPAGTSLTPKTGSLALSPDGGTLYVLWNGLHAISLASGRMTANLALPVVPAYTGLAIAPNGRQAMIWAPSFAAIHLRHTSRYGRRLWLRQRRIGRWEWRLRWWRDHMQCLESQRELELYHRSHQPDRRRAVRDHAVQRACLYGQRHRDRDQRHPLL